MKITIKKLNTCIGALQSLCGKPWPSEYADKPFQLAPLWGEAVGQMERFSAERDRLAQEYGGVYVAEANALNFPDVSQRIQFETAIKKIESLEVDLPDVPLTRADIKGARLSLTAIECAALDWLIQ